jgi:hypothetical protein
MIPHDDGVPQEPRKSVLYGTASYIIGRIALYFNLVFIFVLLTCLYYSYRILRETSLLWVCRILGTIFRVQIEHEQC